VRSILNGTVMQEQGSVDMLFPVRRLIAELSRDLTLLPGTLLLTGTPEGVGFARKVGFARNPPVFLAAGDEIVVEIDGIGRLVNPVIAAGSA
jgi:2-keto-4-pentenoate hydratase/2-oxohepta-3-ene-1,7-dioic acid hydratase in catechol pathway